MTQSGQTTGLTDCRWRAGHQQSGNGLPSVPLQSTLDPGPLRCPRSLPLPSPFQPVPAPLGGSLYGHTAISSPGVHLLPQPPLPQPCVHSLGSRYPAKAGPQWPECTSK